MKNRYIIMILFIIVSISSIFSQEEIKKGEKALLDGIIMTKEKFQYYVEKDALEQLQEEEIVRYKFQISKYEMLEVNLNRQVQVLNEEITLYKNLNTIYKEYQVENEKLKRNNRLLIGGLNISISVSVISLGVGITGILLYYYSVEGN